MGFFHSQEEKRGIYNNLKKNDLKTEETIFSGFILDNYKILTLKSLFRNIFWRTIFCLWRFLRVELSLIQTETPLA